MESNWFQHGGIVLLGITVFFCLKSWSFGGFFGSGVWTQGFTLLGRHSSTWIILPAICFGYFWDRIGFMPRWAWTTVLPNYASHIAGRTGTYHHDQFAGWDGVLLTFCPGWPGNSILPIPISWVAGITGLSPVPPNHAFKIYSCSCVLLCSML
jgi:hypothetical protein